MNFILSGLYKERCSKNLYFYLIFPILFLGAFKAYFMNSSWGDDTRLSIYFSVFGISLIFMIAISVILSYQTEYRIGFKYLNGNFISKNQAHLYNLLVLLIEAAIVLLINVFGYKLIIGSEIIGYKDSLIIFLMFYLFGTIIYLFFYMLVYQWGTGIGYIAGITGTTLSALLLTGIGTDIWMYIPFSMVDGMVLYYLKALLLGQPFMDINIFKCILSFVLWCSFLILLFNKWTLKFEKSPVIEDE